ncbi:hypothetical protein [Castellaniella caeni]|uniref:hypothetical protein n=1 Tax=Castellaniella caeni TaxID=266123 RepID=UPI00082B9398|nr:hypothetical protein [Castellaniella caeni]
MCAEPRARGAAQRGFLLMELMLVAALALMLAIWAGQEWMRRARLAQVQALAVWMGTAHQALEAFVREHGGALARAPADGANAAVPGVADWTAPQAGELRALGFLPPGWQARGPLAQALEFRLRRDATCPQAPCRLQALVAARPGLLRPTGTADEALVAEWLLAAQGQGLAVRDARPQWLLGAGQQIGLSADWRWQPGTVALGVFRVPGADGTQGTGDGTGGGARDDETDGTDHADYLRVRDSRDADFQSTLTVQGQIRSGTWLQARDGLLLEEGQRDGTACALEGGVGRDDRYAGLLVCRQGFWRQLARPQGGGYLSNSRRGCASASGQATLNPVTGSCSCGPGYSEVQVAESGALTAPEGLSRGYVCQPN